MPSLADIHPLEGRTVLSELHVHAGHGNFTSAFLADPNKPMSENTLNLAIRAMGHSAGEMSSHGFQNSASKMLNGRGEWALDAIERQLAHAEQNGARAANS